MAMPDKLQAISLKYSQMEASLSDPALSKDPAAFTKLLREMRRLSPIIEKYREYESACAALRDAEALLSDPDPDLRALASMELKDAKEAIEAIENFLSK